MKICHCNNCQELMSAECSECPNCLAKVEPRPSGAAACSDAVNHPPHYTGHPSGVECITITEHMGFNLGNATKYIWRSDLKNNAVEDLKKAAWYIAREIERRERQNVEPSDRRDQP